MIALYKGISPVSTIIRAFTWSDYTHASYVDDDMNFEIEACWKGGVVEVPGFGKNHTDGTIVDLFSVPLSDFQKEVLEHELRKEVGKRYDFRGACGFATRNDRAQNQAKWFCTELIFAKYAAVGVWLLARTPAHRVNPGHLNMSPLLRHVCSYEIQHGGSELNKIVPTHISYGGRQIRKEEHHEEGLVDIPRLRGLGVL